MDRQASGALTSRTGRLPPAQASPLTSAFAALADRLSQQPDWQGRIGALRELQEVLSQPADESVLSGLRRAVGAGQGPKQAPSPSRGPHSADAARAGRRDTKCAQRLGEQLLDLRSEVTREASATVCALADAAGSLPAFPTLLLEARARRALRAQPQPWRQGHRAAPLPLLQPLTGRPRRSWRRC